MKKSVFVAFVGKPNVGKSSLINGLVDEQILIVSNKPQTTRNKIAAVKTQGKEQFVFFDTPGFFKARNLLDKKMVNSTIGAVSDVDLVVFVVEPKLVVFKSEQLLINRLKQEQIPVILVINKIDLIKNKEKLFSVVEVYGNLLNFDSVVFVSAKKKQGFSDLIFEIRQHEVESSHYFPNYVKTDKSEKFLVSEFFRQSLLVNLNYEVPHSLVVDVDEFKKSKFGLQISVIVYCSKLSHKGIIIGKKGLLLKKIATQSRLKIEQFFRCKVNLKCWVKLKSKWQQNEKFLNSMES